MHLVVRLSCGCERCLLVGLHLRQCVRVAAAAFVRQLLRRRRVVYQLGSDLLQCFLLWLHVQLSDKSSGLRAASYRQPYWMRLRDSRLRRSSGPRRVDASQCRCYCQCRSHCIMLAFLPHRDRCSSSCRAPPTLRVRCRSCVHRKTSAQAAAWRRARRDDAFHESHRGQGHRRGGSLKAVVFGRVIALLAMQKHE